MEKLIYAKLSNQGRNETMRLRNEVILGYLKALGFGGLYELKRKALQKILDRHMVNKRIWKPAQCDIYLRTRRRSYKSTQPVRRKFSIDDLLGLHKTKHGNARSLGLDKNIYPTKSHLTSKANNITTQMINTNMTDSEDLKKPTPTSTEKEIADELHLQVTRNKQMYITPSQSVSELKTQPVYRSKKINIPHYPPM